MSCQDLKVVCHAVHWFRKQIYIFRQRLQEFVFSEFTYLFLLHIEIELMSINIQANIYIYIFRQIFMLGIFIVRHIFIYVYTMN